MITFFAVESIKKGYCRRIAGICIVISMFVQAHLYLSTHSGSSCEIYILCLMYWLLVEMNNTWCLHFRNSVYLAKADVNKYL